jgi:outer membrane autotransporter protein
MRAGFSRTDFESGDIVLNGNSADFETSAGYYGGHFGLGYKWDVTDSGELDLYTKWLWTHLEDDDVTVLGDPVKFKDSDSHRWRTGARFEYSLADKIKPYVGAAYEYEFDGEIEATADGSDIDKPSLKGGTGVGEVGVRLGNLLEKGDLSIDLGLQGSVGQREGMGGSFQLKWLF